MKLLALVAIVFSILGAAASGAISAEAASMALAVATLLLAGDFHGLRGALMAGLAVYLFWRVHAPSNPGEQGALLGAIGSLFIVLVGLYVMLRGPFARSGRK